MGQTRDTRTIHTITIDLQDDMLSSVEPADEVEIVIRGRYGTATKKLTYRERMLMLGEMEPKGRY